MKAWLILDGRAWDDPDRAAVYSSGSEENGETLKDIKKERDEDWPDGVVFEYDLEKREDGKTYMINQTLIG